MYTLKFGEKHKRLLDGIGKTLVQLQADSGKDEFIHDCLLPIVVGGSEEDSEIAEDIITMITEWSIGQTECVYADEDDTDNFDESKAYGLGTAVYFGMSEEQAKRENSTTCIMPELPMSRDLYAKLDSIPDELCESKSLGWEKVIKFRKDNLDKVMEHLFSGCLNVFLYQPITDKIEGDYIWLYGFDN